MWYVYCVFAWFCVWALARACYSTYVKVSRQPLMLVLVFFFETLSCSLSICYSCWPINFQGFSCLYFASFSRVAGIIGACDGFWVYQLGPCVWQVLLILSHSLCPKLWQPWKEYNKIQIFMTHNHNAQYQNQNYLMVKNVNVINRRKNSLKITQQL